ncbi:MAG: exo-alpha-sialidase [Clostridia bacterium]|nr:exo-alpha-sialidase [Clostridia bacterium]
MNVTLLHQLPPSENNPRNSEGSFIRGKSGEILYAYSRYTGEHWGDDCACDIALISSFDEGRTWSEPRIIAKAAEFGVKNIMSVSALELTDGKIAFFFLIKMEKNGISTIELGRAVSENGVDFISEKCDMKCAPYYYVVNNDRFVRLSSGRIVAPTAYIHRDLVRSASAYNHFNAYASSCLYSDDDGKTFYKANFDLRSAYGPNLRTGLQEPGILERDDGLYLWARTNYGC